MTNLDAIKGTKYFTSLTEAEQKTLNDTFDAWPTNLKEEFVKNILQKDKEDDPVQMIGELEDVMKKLKESALVARYEEEKAQKTEETDEVKVLLGQY
jgi:hypothetical protein